MMDRVFAVALSIGTMWSYDFVFSRTHDGRRVWMLTLIDEFTRECRRLIPQT